MCSYRICETCWAGLLVRQNILHMHLHNYIIALRFYIFRKINRLSNKIEYNILVEKKIEHSMPLQPLPHKKKIKKKNRTYACMPLQPLPRIIQQRLMTSSSISKKISGNVSKFIQRNQNKQKKITLINAHNHITHMLFRASPTTLYFPF